MKPVVFVGSGFVAKYPEGGGNFSVVLQYLLGLRALGLHGIWLEVMPTRGVEDSKLAACFRRRLKVYGLERNYCLLVSSEPSQFKAYGLPMAEIERLLSGPNTLLNLSYSIRPPLLERFEHRVLCSLDPTEICFWMARMEMGQSFHHDFVSIGLNHQGPGSRVPATAVNWRTVFPLVDTTSLPWLPQPPHDTFTTVGQWYWDGCVEWDGQWRDFSKKAAFAPYLDLPSRVPEAQWSLAMNLRAGDPEIARLEGLGWRLPEPHRVARTPARYYHFIAQSTAEFSAVKLETFARSGWLSDRSAVYLAMGRPVLTESTGAEPYLPERSGLLFVKDLDEAAEAARRVLADWAILSREARACAEGCFDARRNLRILLEGRKLR